MSRSKPNANIGRAKQGIWWLALLLVVSCGQTAAPTLPEALMPVTTTIQALATPTQPCSSTFVSHTLDHVTSMDGSSAVRMFESNGAGLAINDLDNDGDLDLVLANLEGQNAILWNQGDLTFRKERLPNGDSRAVYIIDVDGDGWQDLVFTRRIDRPAYWRNSVGEAENAHFVPASLPGVYYPAYTIAWGDFDRDGDLDLVTGSYDAALEQAVMSYALPPLGEGIGVYYYERQGEIFIPQQLAPKAQALAIALPDLNADGHPDLLVGNDFDLPDDAWLNMDTGWTPATPFVTTTRNTMSFDLGDIDNDGSPELFAADMKPYDQNIKTLAVWRPMMEKMPHPPSSVGPQINENVLQVRGKDGRFHNQAYERFVDATGWSWSGKFGDLDNDGFLDLYVVNGMIVEGLFDYLPGNELVEENQVLRNDGTGHFVRVPDWGLGSTASGRGMSMADLDQDGDLDIVINNLEGPAQLFENRLCGGASLQVDLFWPTSMNTRAIGSRLVLHTSAGSYYRDVRAASGYLSGDPARLHFGFPANTALQRLEIYWPDGSISSVNTLTPHTLVTITR